jgi:hypothetical protein
MIQLIEAVLWVMLSDGFEKADGEETLPYQLACPENHPACSSVFL